MKKLVLILFTSITLIALAKQTCHCIGELVFFGLTIYKYEKYINVEGDCPDGCASVKRAAVGNGQANPPGIIVNLLNEEVKLPDNINISIIDLEKDELVINKEENNVKSFTIEEEIKLESMDKRFPSITLAKGIYESDDNLIHIPFKKNN
jgi:hypothetical protein